jgi:hypothetical protein
MKRFIISILCVTVFCIGLGAIVENVGARFKSDEKALALIKQARLAIGGEQSLAEVRSMVIKGSTTHTIKVGTETRTEQGETEIAMQLPDKLSKMVRIGNPDGAAHGEKIVNSEKHDVIIMRGDAKGGEWSTTDGGKKVVVRKVEGGNGEVEKIVANGKDGEFTTSDGKKVIIRSSDGAGGEKLDVEKVIVHGPGEMGKRIVMEGDAKMAHHTAARQNELLRTTLSLLLTAPEGMDVSYTYAGEGDVDGTPCNIVNASFGGSNIKLYLSKASSLPVMVSYQGHAMPRVMHFKSKAPEGADVSKDVVTFTHKIEGPETTEVSIRFSDYRGVNGVQLPYKWTTSVAGQTTEVFDVTGYEINPANIAEKFQNQKVFVRTKKEGQ